VATAHEILRVVFAVLSNGAPYKDITVDYEARMVKNNAPRWIKALKKFNLITISDEKETVSIKSSSILISTGMEQSYNDTTKPKMGRPRKAQPAPEVAA
jgi:hypothetical protein